MKYYWIIWVSAFLLSSCVKETEQTELEYIVQGVLQTQKDIQEVKVSQLNKTTGEVVGVEGASVFIYHRDDVYPFEDQGGGVYRSISGELVVEPLGYYLLGIVHEDNTIASATLVPEEFFIENQSETSFYINPETTGQIVFFCNWDYEGDYGQVLDLYSVEESPVAINYTEELEDFFDNYSDPIPNKSVSVNDLNMPYYGKYHLVINVIDPLYESVFFEDLVNGENNPSEGVDNIQGGKGFFTGVSQRIIELEILE